MPADVRITEYTDPACPWAYSAEPFRRRLSWIYGDQLEWDVRMVGLSDDPRAMEAAGFTPQVLSDHYRKISRDHRMPIDTRVRERLAASMPACRAVVAAKLHAPEQMRALLRRLRVRPFSGELLDADDTIDGAAPDAGIDPQQLRGWLSGEDGQRARDADMAAPREPAPAARGLGGERAHGAGAPAKPGGGPAPTPAKRAGGRRYTCPSYETERVADGVRLAVPGFQPFAVYHVITANLLPGLERRENPEEVTEVLAWP